jgi:hypothetical protein
MLRSLCQGGELVNVPVQSGVTRKQAEFVAGSDVAAEGSGAADIDRDAGPIRLGEEVIAAGSPN